MSAELAATFFNIGYGQTLAKSMDKNRVDVLVLTLGQYMSILQDRAKNNPVLEHSLRKMLDTSTFGQYWQKTFSPNAGEPWVGPVAQGANDIATITKTLNAIGMAGITSYVKTSATGTYIIIKGYSIRRSSALQGTRYLATNPKMLQLGLGIKSLQGIAKGGFILGVVVSTGIELMDFMFNNEKTMYDLVGGIGVEAVKGGLGALLAYTVAAGFGLVTTIAVTPLVVMAIAAVGFGVLINAADKEYDIKGKTIAALKTLPDSTTQGLYYIKTETTSWKESLINVAQQKANATGQSFDRALKDWLCPIACRRY